MPIDENNDCCPQDEGVCVLQSGEYLRYEEALRVPNIIARIYGRFRKKTNAGVLKYFSFLQCLIVILANLLRLQRPNTAPHCTGDIPLNGND
jgi:hypothetical protein